MEDVLTRICRDKREHVADRSRQRPFDLIEKEAVNAEAPRGFHLALLNARNARRYGLICEIKRASPSKGLIRNDFDPADLARAYERGGATCLSVLTDEPYFQGADAHLVAARAATALPVLRKDFILEPYQVFESRALGSDCILLILAALDDSRAVELNTLAGELGMDVLVEIHDRKELDRALELDCKLIGINNRNLKTLEVSIDTTCELAKMIPDDRLVIAESGLYSRRDLERCAVEGVTSFLIGESLMRQTDVTRATRRLLQSAAP